MKFNEQKIKSIIGGCLFYGSLLCIGWQTNWTIALCLFLMTIAHNLEKH